VARSGSSVAGAGSLGAGSSGEVQLVLGSGDNAQVVYSGPLVRELRIFIDASLVEVYQSGTVATTLRAYPAPGEGWSLNLPDGATADVWELALPAE